MHRRGLRKRDNQHPGECRITQPPQQVHHISSLTAPRLTLQLPMIRLAGIQQQKRVSRGRGVENDKSLHPLRHLPRKRAKNRDFFRARRTQILLQERPPRVIHRRSLRPHHLRLIRSRLRRGINPAQGQSLHLSRQRLRHMGRRIRRAQMDRLAAAGQSYSNGRCHRGLSDPTLPHSHDHTMPLPLDFIDHVFQALHGRRRPCTAGHRFVQPHRRLTPHHGRLVQQCLQSRQPKNIHRAQRHTKTRHTLHKTRCRRHGVPPALLHGLSHTVVLTHRLESPIYHQLLVTHA